MQPIRLEASLHATIWGGRKLEQAGWKHLPEGDVAIGEAWETEVSTIAQNGPYAGKTLEELVELLGVDLLGRDAVAIFGHRFPLLAKFIDARTTLSVQVHPNDQYAQEHEHGKLGKTECWYILATEPGAQIVHGLATPTTRSEVQQAIEQIKLEELLHTEPVAPGDSIFVPAGTVHAIGGGVLLYELQEYSDVTYRMYDYGRLDAQGKPRELHIERALTVAHYQPSMQIKTRPVTVVESTAFSERCLVACPYFVLREITLHTYMEGHTRGSCLILSALEASVRVYYGQDLEHYECLQRGQTMVLPAALGRYMIEGQGTLLCSYVPANKDETWRLWCEQNNS